MVDYVTLLPFDKQRALPKSMDYQRGLTIHKPSFARVRPCILLANERWKIMIDLGSHCP